MKQAVASTLLLLLSAPAICETFVRETNVGCQVETRAVHDGETFAWSGSCKGGKASGSGALTSSLGAYLQGEFRSGEMIDVSGRWPMEQQNGTLMLLAARYSKQAEYIARPLLASELQHFYSVASDPLVGQWRLESLDGACKEVYTFSSGGVARIESAEERLTKAVALLRSARDGYALLATVIEANRRPDCLGRLTEVGQTTIRLLQMIDRDALLLCDRSAPSNCYAKLVRTSECAHCEPVSKPISSRQLSTSEPQGLNYGQKIRAAILPYIDLAEPIEGNPVAQVKVTTRPDGEVVDAEVVQSSGYPRWDKAVRIAVLKVERIPLDVDGKVPAVLYIHFRPK